MKEEFRVGDLVKVKGNAAITVKRRIAIPGKKYKVKYVLKNSLILKGLNKYPPGPKSWYIDNSPTSIRPLVVFEAKYFEKYIITIRRDKLERLKNN